MSARGAVALLLLLAFVLRLAANQWLTVPTPGIDGDALWYHSTATSLAAGHGYVHYFTRLPTAAWPPGYPAILAAVYRVFGADPAWAFLLNAITGTVTCWLAGRLALAIVSPRAQVVATALAAVTPSHVLFASLLLSETVYTTIMTALVLGAIVLVRRSTRSAPSQRPGQRSGRIPGNIPWLAWFAWGIGVGLASLVRAEAIVLVAAPVVVLLVARHRAAAVAGVAIASVLGIVVAELPWLVRNAMLFGRVVPVSTSFGRTFLIGHNPVAEGDMNSYSPDPAADERDLSRGGPALELAVDERLRDAGVRFMLEHPGVELQLVGRRFYSMFRGDRVWGEWYFAADPARVPPSAVEALGKVSNLFYWLLLLVALPGFVLGVLSREDSRLLLAVVIVAWTAFFVVVLYGSQRFHFPLMPLFCVLAADVVCRRPLLAMAGSPTRPAPGAA